MNRYLRWLSTTASSFWNDSASPAEINRAIEDGGNGMTTNPVIVCRTCAAEPEVYGVLPSDGPVERTRKVAAHYASILKPFVGTKPGAGYICAQVDPNKTYDRDFMLEAAKKYHEWAPNIVVKLPATYAGIDVYEECVSLGIPVAATLGFSVSQSLAVAEAWKRGAARAKANGIEPELAISVIMAGRLNDYLRDCALDGRYNVTEEDIQWASIATLKRAYAMIEEAGSKVFLMPAGLRSIRQITECAGARMIMSISPAMQDAMEDSEQIEKISVPVPSAPIERLLKMPEFCKAYEPDGMKKTDFIGYGVVERTTTFFIDNGWSKMTAK